MPPSPPPEPGSPRDPRPASPPSSSPPASPGLGRQTTGDSTGLRRTSSASNRIVRASTRLLDSNPPVGMWHATGHVAAKAPTISDIRHGGFTHKGWSAEGQRSRSQSVSSTGQEPPSSSTAERAARGSKPAVDLPGGPIAETRAEHQRDRSVDGRPLRDRAHDRGQTRTVDTEKVIAASLAHKAVAAELHDVDRSEKAKPVEMDSSHVIYPNGYKPPPKHTWAQATAIAAKGFWRFFCTPVGFLITIYGLNVVAWGGMLFLLLINAAPAMCNPTCDDINSPRRKWVEIDSQILNALFCVTGFGLIPWRFRDLYYLLKWRVMKRTEGVRVLAGIHRGWFRLPGSEKLPKTLGGGRSPSTLEDATDHHNDDGSAALPIPASKAPDPPLTGFRAPPTKAWKLDFVIWMYVLNTFLQAVLSAFMWGYNRIDRPGWSTGTFVALACIVAGAAGIMVFVEGKRVKKVEGVPVTQGDLAIIEDLERGRKV